MILHSGLISNSLREDAFEKGKSIIVYEGGQSLRYDEFAIQEGVNGTLRLMKALGMYKERVVEPSPWPNILLPKATWIRAEVSGLFNAVVSNGHWVNEGDVLGYITNPYNDYHYDISATSPGYLIGLNHSPVIHAGDALFHIGLTEGGPNEN